MRHGKGHSVRLRIVGEGFGIVTAGGALQPVELHQQRLRVRNWGQIQEVNVDEISVWRGPSLAPKFRLCATHAPSVERAPDGLQIAAG
jgi:hypothetical protein